MTWCAGRGGRRVELLHPTPEQVDFVEIAWALAGINRYGGHAEIPISVGQHTLIVFDAAPPELKPHALLHDAHEARLGDTTSPQKETFQAAARELAGPDGENLLRQVRLLLERRHDHAIWTAAGLPVPRAAERAALKVLDARALATERRDFFGTGPSMPEWIIDRQGVEPFPRVYRFRARDKVADALLAAFHQWLPALRARAA